jgi:hypothetical protein
MCILYGEREEKKKKKKKKIEKDREKKSKIDNVAANELYDKPIMRLVVK